MKIAKTNNPFKIGRLKLRRGDTLVIYGDIDDFEIIRWLKRTYPYLKDVIILPSDARLSVIQE